MKRTITICDCCGKEEKSENYDPTIEIGNFKGRCVQVRTSYFKILPSGFGPWGEVDLCWSCKQKVLVFAAQKWAKGYIESHGQGNYKEE